MFFSSSFTEYGLSILISWIAIMTVSSIGLLPNPFFIELLIILFLWFRFAQAAKRRYDIWK